MKRLTHHDMSLAEDLCSVRYKCTYITYLVNNYELDKGCVDLQAFFCQRKWRGSCFSQMFIYKSTIKTIWIVSMHSCREKLQSVLRLKVISNWYNNVVWTCITCHAWMKSSGWKERRREQRINLVMRVWKGGERKSEMGNFRLQPSYLLKKNRRGKKSNFASLW